MNLEQKLVRLGLSEKEARVYLAMLELGKSSISEIALKARINRTTTYDVVSDLKRDGLVAKSADAKKKKKVFEAESPEKLPILLETKAKKLTEQAQNAQKLMRELKFLAQKQPGRPKFKLFEGREGIKSLYEDTLTSRTDIDAFCSADSLVEFDSVYMPEYHKRRARKNIFIRAIMNEGRAARIRKEKDAIENRESRIVGKEEMDIEPEVNIYDNKIAILSLKEEFGILIESADIAKAFRKLYKLAWERAGEKDLSR